MKGIIPTEKWAIRMLSAIKEAGKSEREELGTRMMARAGKAETTWKRGKHSARNRGGKICRCNEWRKHEEFFSLQKKKSWIELWSERRKTASWLYTLTMKYPQDSYWYSLVQIIILRLQNSSQIPFSGGRFVWFAFTKNSRRLFYIYMEWFCVGWRNFGTCR